MTPYMDNQSSPDNGTQPSDPCRSPYQSTRKSPDRSAAYSRTCQATDRQPARIPYFPTACPQSSRTRWQVPLFSQDRLKTCGFRPQHHPPSHSGYQFPLQPSDSGQSDRQYTDGTNCSTAAPSNSAAERPPLSGTHPQHRKSAGMYRRKFRSEAQFPEPNPGIRSTAAGWSEQIPRT